MQTKYVKKMPYKTDKLKIDSPFMDRRTKLLPCQRERMILLFSEGYSQRQLADIFNVSRRLVQFTIDPEKLKQNLKARQERGGTKIYYDKDKHKTLSKLK